MKHVTLPLQKEEIETLQAGEPVLLSGTMYTARDAAPTKLVEMIERGEQLPFDLQGASIYYVGPTPARDHQVIGSAGPTTSSRMDPYVPLLAENGLKGMIGKGRTARQVIALPELLAEAVARIEVKDFPCFVGLDIHGNDIYDMED